MRPPFVLFLTREQIDALHQVLERALEDRALPIDARAAIASAFASLRNLRDSEILASNGSGSKGLP